jgi:hypothetical protein
LKIFRSHYVTQQKFVVSSLQNNSVKFLLKFFLEKKNVIAFNRIFFLQLLILLHVTLRKFPIELFELIHLEHSFDNFDYQDRKLILYSILMEKVTRFF